MYIIRQIIFSYIFSRRLKKREEFHWIIIPGLMLLAAMAIVSQWGLTFDLNTSKLYLSNSPLGLILSTLFFSASTVLIISFLQYQSFEVNYFEAMYAATLGYISEHFDYCLAGIWGNWLPGRLVAFLQEPLPSLLRLILFAILMDWIFAKHLIHGHHYIAQSLHTAILLICSVLVVALISAISTEYGFAMEHKLYASILCLFLLSSQIERQQALSLQGEYKVREQLLVSQQAQYDIYKENVELVNRKCHDLKHQMEAIKHMTSEEAKNQALSQIEEAVLIYDSFIKTGSKALDTILTQKNHICLEHDILFTCVADGSLLDFMEDVDLYTLFGNLMDNAIEAVSSLPKEKRTISLFLGQEKGLIMINEENFFHTLAEENHKLLTTKGDKESHGYGLTSISLAVEKYGGFFHITHTKEKFQASIVFPPR